MKHQCPICGAELAVFNINNYSQYECSYCGYRRVKNERED